LINTIKMDNPLLWPPAFRDKIKTLFLEAVNFHTATPKTPSRAACWA
jgi:ribonucleoside-diphosphate reductase beta chain